MVVLRVHWQKWFERWRWLHYDCVGDKVICYLCVTALKTGKIKPDDNIDKAFVVQGYTGRMHLVRKEDLLVMSAAQFTKEQLRMLKPFPDNL